MSLSVIISFCFKIQFLHSIISPEEIYLKHGFVISFFHPLFFLINLYIIILRLSGLAFNNLPISFYDIFLDLKFINVFYSLFVNFL